MPQTSVNDEFDRAYEGKVENSGQYPTTVNTGLALSDIIFGKGVASTVSDVDLPKRVGMYAAALIFQGVTIADPSIEPVGGNDYGTYAAESAVPVMRKGRVWVVTADVVDSLAKNVFIRSATPGGSPPAESLGSFRATTVADYIDLTAIANVSWVSGVTIGAVNFGLLELNLP